MKVPEPRKLKSGTWFIQLRLNGVSVPVSAPSKAECKNRAMLIKAEHKSSKRQITQPSELTLREVCERYISLREKKQGISPTTLRGYDIIVRNRFKPYMNRRVSSIKDWQKVYDDEAAIVAPKTVQNAFSFIRSACKREGILIPEIETGIAPKRERPFFDPEQIKIFISAIQDHPQKIAMLLCLSSLRASEVQALTWDKVDIDKKMVYVRGAVVPDRQNKLVYKEQNKTEDSTRAVPIFIPELYDALKAVPDKTGSVVKVRANWVYKSIIRVCEENNLPLVGEHGLRHSFASLCYSLKVPIKITMAIGGWSDYNTVLKVYTHLAKKDIISETGKLENFFLPNNNANENANELSEIV